MFSELGKFVRLFFCEEKLRVEGNRDFLRCWCFPFNFFQCFAYQFFSFMCRNSEQFSFSLAAKLLVVRMFNSSSNLNFAVCVCVRVISISWFNLSLIETTKNSGHIAFSLSFYQSDTHQSRRQRNDTWNETFCDWFAQKLSEIQLPNHLIDECHCGWWDFKHFLLSFFSLSQYFSWTLKLPCVYFISKRRKKTLIEMTGRLWNVRFAK